MAARRKPVELKPSLAAVCLFTFVLHALTPATVAQESLLGQDTFRGFISTTGGRFVDEDCREFPVVGMNG